jgi:tetratricopeptide (TPR) repeat protein
VEQLERVAYNQGDCEGALGYWQEALGLYRSSGNKPATAEAVLSLSAAARRQGDERRAEQLIDEGLALALELTNPRYLVWALYRRGQLALARENRSHASKLFAEGLVVSQENRFSPSVAVYIAGLAAAEVDPAQAVRLFGAAQALLDAAGGSLDRDDQAAYDRALNAVRIALDEGTFARGWAEGRAMASSEGEPAIAYALGRAVGPTD